MINHRRLSQRTAGGITLTYHYLRCRSMILLVPNLNAMPIEILHKIFSHLTFRDCIRCTGVSKRIRQIILKWPRLVHTLSNERCRHNLSQVMIPYLQHVNGLGVHAIELTADRITSDLPLRANQELIQFMDMLEYWQCYAIKQATIRLYCFSEQWLNKLINLASISLTSLDLWTAIDQQHMESAITMLLAYFRNLNYLHFASSKFYVQGSVSYHQLIAGNSEASTTATTTSSSSNEVDLLQHWRQEMQLQSYVSTPIQHFNLGTFQLTCDSAFVNGQTVTIFQRIPNLRHLMLSDYFLEQDSIRTVFSQLFQYCPHLESIIYVSRDSSRPPFLSYDIHGSSVITSTFVVQVDINDTYGCTTKNTGDSTATHSVAAAKTTARELTISGYADDQNAHWFTGAMLRLFYNNFTSIDWGYPFCNSEHQTNFCNIDCFAALERLVVECIHSVNQNHHGQFHPQQLYEPYDHGCSTNLRYFLCKCPNLREVRLTTMTLDRESIATLQSLPKLESITFENCKSVYENDIQGIIRREKWNSHVKVKIVKTNCF
ncbi:hypothetical protein BDB00DRAFT_822192 [Zychaea mexicana]|uniref:uncharacterized protein n=1 Tax=Zychaea mexicana TaxID=64656 RepID=UPI0022FE5097|nr:uncharacterized protein BDB00DRAFT_822192 [Zychaea mexicana]KAI9493703.1 hypothetical protein BDB00DRAFT_822192 [Zychaea mexicana]